ncbi:ATP-dependent helicase HrpB [Cumulibacter manganitolerans]|uniref:ATP-dependent helicase HrpB n=1 Tax=Cumulibacter manganitolerans TaxID=1884992 RepID=UPI0012978A8E|nr:ATP-dependent helicase HrpB [Cumulibacter manganitolerans]
MFDISRIGSGLPFAAATADLAAAVREARVAVVEAPPGTGKTTLAPPVIAGEVAGRVVVTQPRRVAARAAAHRLAALTGTATGQLVGYTVRGEHLLAPGARIEMVTPGVLLRRLLDDPGLDGVGAVVLDEVHERGLDTDLLVGLLAEVRELREDLVLVAMSATLDAAGFAALIGTAAAPAPLVGVSAERHPLAERWAPPPSPALDARGVTAAFLTHVADVVRRAIGEHPGDALVFLPGVREVRAVAGALAGSVDAEVLQLHGQVGPREQDRAVAARREGDRRRVVVSTSLAESSLTVDGVRIVVDAGLSREPRRDAARGMSGLVTVRCARPSADQRAGRAARQDAGVIWRCYDEATYSTLRPDITPEVANADLTGALLSLACWGAPRGETLRLPTALPTAAVRDGEETLRALGAVDDAGRVTVHGRRLAALPVAPRWARALLDGAPLVGRRRAAEIVAGAELDLGRAEPDLLKAVTDLRSRAGDKSGRSGRGTAHPGGHAGGRGSDPERPRGDAARWGREVARLERLLPQRDGARADSGRPAGLVVALAYPERIARRTGASYLLASGTRAAAPADLDGHEWLAIADVTRASGRPAGGTGAVIRTAAPIDLDGALLAGESLVVEEVRGALNAGRLTARRVRALGAIELSSTPVPASSLGLGAVEDVVRREGLEVIGWSPQADTLRRRLALLRHHLGDPWPDVSDEALLGRLGEWLAPELARAAESGRLGAIDLHDPLRRLLPWPEATRLDELVPERLRLPSGARVRLEYPPFDAPDGAVVCAVRLQEVLGLTASPTIGEGRLRVQFQLLSPARRPVAITDDLASFWAGPYAQVRADMRGRYPKHAWPEDPLDPQYAARPRTGRGRASGDRP